YAPFCAFALLIVAQKSTTTAAQLSKALYFMRVERAMRKGELIINYGVVLAPLFFGVGLSLAISFVYAAPLAATIVFLISVLLSGGFLIFSKLPTLRHGKWLHSEYPQSNRAERNTTFCLAFACHSP